MIVAHIEPQPSPDEAAAIEFALKSLGRSHETVTGKISRWATSQSPATGVSRWASSVGNDCQVAPRAERDRPRTWAQAARLEAIRSGV